MKQPRDYQNGAHESTWNYIHDPSNFTGGVATKGKGPKYPLVVEATGLGKSLNIAMLIWHLLSVYPGLRIMQLCHVKELVEGNYLELLGMWPTAPAGIYASGLNRADTRSQVTFAMINSVTKRPATFGHIDFILIDEAHRLSPNDAAMYTRFLDAMRKRNPNLVVVGYTATDYRMQGGRLTEMDLFDDVVYDIGSGESFLWAVENGYLILPVPVDPGFKVDDSAISISTGDFTTSEASAALHEQDIIERAVDFSVMIAKEQNRLCGLAFAQSIDDSELIAEMFTYKGFPMEAVHSKRGDRDQVIAAHKAGDLWGVANKDILTTGWNNPRLDLMAVLRLTRSPGLWVQMVGRITRPSWVGHIGHNGGPPLYDINTLEGRLASILASHKQTGLVLDFVGNTERLGPINYPNLPRRRGKGGGEPPVRTCSLENGGGCSPSTYHHVSVKICPHCGYEWPVESNLSTDASNQDLVTATNPLGLPAAKSIEKEYEVYGVHEMTAVRHEGKVLKRGDDGSTIEKRPDTVKVIYRSGFNNFPVWVCFGHPDKSFPRKKACDWWEMHEGEGAAPSSVDVAVDAVGGLRKPKFIKVWTNTKFPEIVGYDFEGHKFVLDLSGEKVLHEPDEDPMEEIKAQAGKAAYYVGDSYDDDIPF